MNALTKGLLGALVVGAALFLASPKQAEARRWVYYSPVAPVVAPVPAPVYSAYYPVYPRRYRAYYAPTYVVPTYPAPYYYYGY